jgi:hypothetical protein
MTDLRAAARQALEALETVFMPHHPAVIALRAALTEEALQRLTDANQEIEAVLEQPEQDWEDLYRKEKARADMWRGKYESLAGPDERVYPQQEQEPVAYLYHDASTPRHAHPWLHSTMLVLAADRRPSLRGETPLYTHTPRREWRGLTEEDIWTLAANCMDSVLGRLHFARAVEATLKERNA